MYNKEKKYNLCGIMVDIRVYNAICRHLYKINKEDLTDYMILELYNTKEYMGIRNMGEKSQKSFECSIQEYLNSLKNKTIQNNDNIDKFDEIAKYWNNKMPIMVVEELAECIQAISKEERYHNEETKEHLVEEIGDVIISINSLICYYKNRYTDIEEKVNLRIKNKLNKKY